MKSKYEKLSGPFSAIFTPFDSENRVNFEMLSRIAEFQIRCGIRGFFVCGSTGEGLLLSEDERVAVVRQMVEHCRGRATVIAHVGHPSSDFAANLAKQSAEVGADWIASVAPIYHGTTFAGAIRHYTQIAAATDLPFMIYSIGAEIEPKRDVRFFDIPHVHGMKYTGANFFSVQQLARIMDRDITLMSGFDEQFVAAQSFGFDGGIGSTYNFAPKYYADIYRLYHENDIVQASQVQAEVNKVTHLMIEYENWSYRKAIMRYIGFDCGPYRAPYAPISESEYDAYAQRLDELGVLKRNEGVELLSKPAEV